MRNLYRKPTNLYCNAGSKFSISAVLWSLLGCLILLHLYSNVHRKDGDVEEVQLRVSNHPQFCELQKVVLENIQIPSLKGKRSPQAAKHRPKRTTTLMDENSSLRHVFYLGEKTAVDPMKAAGNDSYYYHPGRIWLDTDGNPIQAHGGGILYDEKSRIYYW